MLALSLGLTAALIWAVHDLMARKLSQGAALLPIVLLVLTSGTVVLAAPALLMGDWSNVSGRAVLLSFAAGLTLAVAIGGLYRAFSMAPTRIVASIIGAYPMVSLALAVAQGRSVTIGDWVAVAVVVAGIAMVCANSSESSPSRSATRSYLPAMAWAFLSACGYATTFAIGQQAARETSDLPTILITRLVAALAIVALFLWTRSSLVSLRGNWRVLAVMGAIDAVALTLVTAAGTLPHAEYAAVSSSLFGVGTILLASYFLNEKLRWLQWVGVATVFSGIATLTLQI
jgi:drug/metabolite transporter (DMT)-like permease